MHMASGRIRNPDDVGTGTFHYVVPHAVAGELRHLAASPAKAHQAARALEMIQGMKSIDIRGPYADGAILNHVRERGGFVATTDKKLKALIKAAGGHIVSLHDDRIVVEQRGKT